MSWASDGWRNNDELVIPMPPISMVAIEELAFECLAEVVPDALTGPKPLDVLHLVDYELPKRGIYVSPAAEDELGWNEGLTDPAADEEEVEILILEEHWNNLINGGPRSYRARATVMHEFGHHVLHVPTIRRRMKMANRELLLARVRPTAIKPYRNPEWQAWAFAGCIMAPRFMIEGLPHLSVRELARFFQMSEGFLLKHLDRLRINRR